MKIISEDQLLSVKAELSQSETMSKRVPISAISVTPDSLKVGMIHINNNPVLVSTGFFNKLGSLLKLNSSLTRDMINKGDTQVAASLINGLRSYQSANKRNSDVILIASSNTKEIIDICPPSRYRRVTNDTLFDVTSRILNENPNLIIETVDVNANNGKASINFLNNQEVGFAQAGKDEFFKFGFSIVQTNKDTIVESYNQRLVCSNGLRTSLGEGQIGANRDIRFEDTFRLAGTSTEDIRIFLNKIEEMKKAGFIPGGFESTINRALSTKASLLEIENGVKLATSKIHDVDVDLAKMYKTAVSNKYFPSYTDTIARITKKGVDHSILGDRQKQFIKTGMSVWDVINSLTFLGSNNSGYPIDNQHELKYSAGKLFAKGVKEGYDLEYSQYASL
jgi:hypothetical protein